MKGKIAICTLPGTAGGGVFTSFVSLKNNLEPLGWSVTGISIGNTPWDPLYHEDPYGCVRIAGHLDAKESPKEAAMAFVDWCVTNSIDIVVPLNSPIVTSAIPFLPPSIKVVMRCNNNRPRVYKYISSHSSYVSSWIFVSQGQVEETTSFRFPEKKVVLIPHGIKNIASEAVLAKGGSGVLRLGFLGRLHHGSKGILLIPEILDELDTSAVRYSMEIVGSGEDELTLKAMLKEKTEQGTVVFKGSLQNHQVSDVVKSWDLFLMPSRFEGFGIVLIETMIWGVVPVASKISGVTDWIVKDGVSGFLCDMESPKSFVEAIIKLNQDRELLHRMSQAARREVQERFSLQANVAKYDKVFSSVLAEPSRSIAPKSWDKWQPYEEYKSLRSYFTRLIPSVIKSYIKKKL